MKLFRAGGKLLGDLNLLSSHARFQVRAKSKFSMKVIENSFWSQNVPLLKTNTFYPLNKNIYLLCLFI